MVGNDVQEDGVAATLGMDLFIVTDHLIDREQTQLPPDRSGSLAQFLDRLIAGL